jgi:hypothetical protein
VIEAYKDFGEDFDRMIEETDLTKRELRTALGYYRRSPREIDEFIDLDRRSLAELLATYPLAEPITLDIH